MFQVIKIETNGQVQWNIAKSNAGQWIGVCRPLGLTMEGNTLEDLLTSINEAVQAVMIDLMESGELDTFLRNRGWMSMPQPMPQHPTGVRFDIPIALLPLDSTRELLQQAA